MSSAAGFFSGITLVLVAISIHEFAHAWAANALGDPTARYRGRVTLDPLAHLDPVGTLMILFTAVAGVGIGWGRPVPVVPANFRKNPPLGLALSSAAGPLSNLAQAAVAAMLLQGARLALPAVMPEMVVTVGRVAVAVAGLAALAGGGGLFYLWFKQRQSAGPNPLGDFSWRVVDAAPGTPWWQNEETLKAIVRGGMGAVLFFGFLVSPQGLLITAVYVNIALALFNLIPLGPLDGNGILRGLLLASRAQWTLEAASFLDRIQPHSSTILFGLIFLEQILHIPLLSLPILRGSQLIARLLGV